MFFFKPIWQIFIYIWQWLKANNWNVLLGIFIALGIVGGIDGYFYCKAIGNGTPISLADFAGGILAIIGILLLSKRTFNQDRQLEIQSEQLQKQDKQLEYQQKQIQFQVDKEVDDRFTSAITLLGSNQTSARTGALYVLYDLAIKNDKYRKQVAEIICAHIRGHTQMPDYKKENKEKPSDEIQTAINLLFRGSETQDQKGFYCHSFAASLHRPNLSHSFLRGANFHRAICICADFRYADCIGAVFMDGIFQGADFMEAHCQGAYFEEAECQGAYFIKTKCQGADFSRAQCQGANFNNTQCQGAIFDETQCQGAIAKGAFLDTMLKDQVGQLTELINVVFVNDLKDDWLDKLQSAVEIRGKEWFKNMKKIHEEHSKILDDNTLPKGIKEGELDDTEEIRKIIAEIEKYD